MKNFKKLVALMIAFTFVLSAFAVNPCSAATTTRTESDITGQSLVITNSARNVRSEPDTSSSKNILGTAAVGTKLPASKFVKIVTGSGADAQVSYWVKVTYNNNANAYVNYAEGYCVLETASETKKTSVSSDYSSSHSVVYIKNKGGINVRSAGNGFANIIDCLYYGETAEFVEYADTHKLWAKVIYQDDEDQMNYGYVYVGADEGLAEIKKVDTSIDGTEGMGKEKFELLTDGFASVKGSKNISIYQSPCSVSRKLTTIPSGTVVSCFSQSKNWVDIKFIQNGKIYEGFILASQATVISGKKKVTTSSYSVKKNQKLQLAISIVERTTLTHITWSSSKKKVATVSKSGKVTGKKKGSATISAKLYNGDKLLATVKFPVKVK